MTDTILDLITNLPLDSISEALIAASLSLLVWFVAKMRKKVAQELSPNGGSSTKDVLLRLEKQVCKIENELKFTSTSFRFLHNSINYCAFRTDAEGHNVWITDKYMEFIGLNENDLLGLDWLNIVPLEYQGVLWRERVVKEFKACLDMQRVYKMTHPIFVHKNGKTEIVFIDAVAYPVIVDGELLGSVGGFVKHPTDKVEIDAILKS